LSTGSSQGKGSSRPKLSRSFGKSEKIDPNDPRLFSKAIYSSSPSNEYRKYRKLLGVWSEEAIKITMKIDGLTDNQIEAAFANGRAETDLAPPLDEPGLTGAGASSSQPSLNMYARSSGLHGNSGNSSLKKYRKMLTMLPESTVRNRMKVDGYRDDDIDAFFAVDACLSVHSTTIPAVFQTLPPESKKAYSTTAGGEDPFKRTHYGGGGGDPFKKYRKMLSMFPVQAIRFKMKADGYSDEEVEAFVLHELRQPESPTLLHCVVYTKDDSL